MGIEQQEIYYAYLGNGVTASFPYGCRIFSATDLVVKVSGVVQALGVHYTISGVDAAGGGEITFIPAAVPANGLLVELERVLSYSRQTGYVETGDFRPETVDRDQDYQTALLQQMEYRLRQLVSVQVSVTAAAAVSPVFIDAQLGPASFELPESGEVVVVKEDDTANEITISDPLGRTVDRQASITLKMQADAVRLRLNPAKTNWYIIT